MSKWKFKGCSRCGGDLMLEKGEYGWLEHCLQCGHEHELGNITPLKRVNRNSEKLPVASGH